MKIKYVQLESQAFMTDLDFMTMTPAERGVYCTLILHLYCNGGKCEFNLPALAKLCNCRNFERIWEKIAKKFQTREGVIRHKRVTKEIRRTKRFLQSKRRAGLASAAKRNAASTLPQQCSNTSATKKRKGNVIEREEKASSNTNTPELAHSVSNSVRRVANGICDGTEPASGSIHSQALHFNQALQSIIPPRTRSDRTCFRNVTNWLIEGCAAGRFNNEIFARVLDLAKEARGGRRPPAVFMALMKKELRYKNG